MRHLKLINHLNRVINDKRNSGVGARTLRDLVSNEKRCRTAISLQIPNASHVFDMCFAHYNMFLSEKIVMPHGDIVIEFEWNDGHAYVVWFQQRKNFVRTYFYLASKDGIFVEEGQCEFRENRRSITRWKNRDRTLNDDFVGAVLYILYTLTLPKFDFKEIDPRPHINAERAKHNKKPMGLFIQMQLNEGQTIQKVDGWKNGSTGEQKRNSPVIHWRMEHEKIYNKGKPNERRVRVGAHLVGGGGKVH